MVGQPSIMFWMLALTLSGREVLRVAVRGEWASACMYTRASVSSRKAPHDAVEDLVGGVPVAALFQTQVVLGADAGEQGDLLPAQTGHPSALSGGQSDILGAHLFAAGSQVVTQLARCCHESQGRSRRPPHPVPVGTRDSGAWSPRRAESSVNGNPPQAPGVRLRRTTPREQR